MTTIIDFPTLLKTIFETIWGLILAFRPLLIPAIIVLIIKLFVTRGVRWSSIVSGDSKRITHKKVKIAQDTVDLLSSVHDLNNK